MRRTEEEMLALIMQTAKTIPAVKAVAMNGSRGNSNAPKDDFQDFDIVYFVPDEAMDDLIEHQEWLKVFGERIIMQTPESFVSTPCNLGGRFTFLMLFKDGNRIDLMLCPLSKISAWHKEDPVGAILYDPDSLLPHDMETTDRIYWVKEPTQQHFQECCNEFWWVSTYVVKGLCRNELFYASDHFYDCCYQELLRILSWQVGERHQYQISVGKNHKYLLKHLDENLQKELTCMLNFTSLEKMAEALVRMQHLFHRLAIQYSESKNFVYNDEEAKNVLEYTEKVLEIFRK